METNGSRPQPDWKIDHITVSPKTAQGARLDPWFLANATEFKHVISESTDLPDVIALSQTHDKPASLQPNSLIGESVGLCVDAVQLNPTRFRLSLQTHKILNVR